MEEKPGCRRAETHGRRRGTPSARPASTALLLSNATLRAGRSSPGATSRDCPHRWRRGVLPPHPSHASAPCFQTGRIQPPFTGWAETREMEEKTHQEKAARISRYLTNDELTELFSTQEEQTEHRQGWGALGTWSSSSTAGALRRQGGTKQPQRSPRPTSKRSPSLPSCLILLFFFELTTNDPKRWTGSCPPACLLGAHSHTRHLEEGEQQGFETEVETANH